MTAAQPLSDADLAEGVRLADELAANFPNEMNARKGIIRRQLAVMVGALLRDRAASPMTAVTDAPLPDPMTTARMLVEAHINTWGYIPHPNFLKESIAATLEKATLARAAPAAEQQVCSGGIDPGFGECPKCGATMDDTCKFDSAPAPAAEGEVAHSIWLLENDGVSMGRSERLETAALIRRLVDDRDEARAAVTRLEESDDQYDALLTSVASERNALAAQLPVQGSEEEVARLAEIMCDAYEGEDGSYSEFNTAYKRRWQHAVRTLFSRFALPRPQEGWQPGGPRCDECDSGLERGWVYCPFCARFTTHENPTPATQAGEEDR